MVKKPKDLERILVVYGGSEDMERAGFVWGKALGISKD